jgi:hypothetical protein
VLTFEPHPRTVFRPDQPVFRLTPGADEGWILGQLGFDAVIEHPFNKEFSSQSAEDVRHPTSCAASGRPPCGDRLTISISARAGKAIRTI